jgi:hypothetical protein
MCFGLFAPSNLFFPDCEVLQKSLPVALLWQFWDSQYVKEGFLLILK